MHLDWRTRQYFQLIHSSLEVFLTAAGLVVLLLVLLLLLLPNHFLSILAKYWRVEISFSYWYRISVTEPWRILNWNIYLALTRSLPFVVVHTTLHRLRIPPSLYFWSVRKVQSCIARYAFTYSHVVSSRGQTDCVWWLCSRLSWHSRSFRSSVDALGAPKLFWRCFDRHMHWIPKHFTESRMSLA